MHNKTIRKYLLNELSPEERNAFEQEMESDPFLREIMDGLEEWLMNKDVSEILFLENELGKSIHRFVLRPKNKKTILLRTLRYASATCILGALSFFAEHICFTKSTADTEKIFAYYFKPLTHPDATVRGENKILDDTPAIQAYEKEDYFTAVRHYEQLAMKDPKNIKNNLFLGISLLSTNQPGKAIDILNKVPPADAAEFNYDLQWYLALAYLKMKEIEKARSLFRQLCGNENYYRKPAKEILSKLNGRTASEN
jgi:hypothetical protein